jgi:hypothetical protein
MDIQQRFIDRMTNVKNSGELVDASQDVLRFNDYAARLDQMAAFISVVEDQKVRDAGMAMLSDIAEQITLYTENLIVQRELVHKQLQDANDARRTLLHSRTSLPTKGLAKLAFKLVGKNKQARIELVLLEKIADKEQRARQAERKIIHLRTQLEHSYMVRCELLQQSLLHNGVSISGAYLPKLEDQMQILDRMAEYNTTLDIGSLKGLFMLKSSDVPSIGFSPAKNKAVMETSATLEIAKTTPKVRSVKPKTGVPKSPQAPSAATVLNKEA